MGLFCFWLKKERRKGKMMKNLNVTKFIKNAQFLLSKHSPEILTGLGIAGMVTTTILSVKATPKAMKICEVERLNRVNEYEEEPTKLEYVKACWKCYIPAAVTGTVSIACLIGASSVNVRRNTALATAYKLSETALTEYREKVVETIGEKKEKTIKEAIAKDKIEKDPVTQQNIIVTDKGDTLCYDELFGRYFKSDIDKLKKIENDLSFRMRNEDYISLNEFYYEVGLDSVKAGDLIGWNINRCPKGIELDFSSQLASDGTPCLVVGFNTPPQYDYDR